MISLGENKIGENTVFQGTGDIVIGKRTFVGRGCVLSANAKISLGQDIMIADYVSIRDSDHVFNDLDEKISKQGIVSNPVIIRDNVWVGHGVTILKGVEIGEGTIIAAGAVVTKSFPPNSIIGGIPARLISTRI